MNRFTQVALILMSACMLYSCSFKRLVAGKKPGVYVWDVVHDTGKDANRPLPQPYVATTNADSAVMLKQLITEVTPVWNSRLQFRTFLGKAKMHMEAPDDKQEFTAHFRVRKDSVIWVTITAMGGLTFARIFITQDSFFMTNPLQKTAICVPLNKAAKVLPAKVDFSSLQNLILGEPLRDGVLTDATDFKDSWSVRVEDSSYIQLITYQKSDSTMQSGQLRTHNPSGPTATTQYSKYETADNRRMATERVLHLKNGNDVYSLEMNFVKFSFDEAMDFPFSIPKNYTIKQ